MPSRDVNAKTRLAEATFVVGGVITVRVSPLSVLI